MHADIGKLAKQAIFSLHRCQDDEAVQRLDKAAGIAAELAPILSAEPDLRHGSVCNAMEEVCLQSYPAPRSSQVSACCRLPQLHLAFWLQFAEARLFRGFLQEGRLMPSSELPTCSRDE